MESITKRIKEFLNVRSGSGSGNGDGDGYGYGVKKVNNHDIYIVDDTPTIITALFNNYAKGYIVGNDLTLKPCYIAKKRRHFCARQNSPRSSNRIARQTV